MDAVADGGARDLLGGHAPEAQQARAGVRDPPRGVGDGEDVGGVLHEGAEAAFVPAQLQHAGVDAGEQGGVLVEGDQLAGDDEEGEQHGAGDEDAGVALVGADAGQDEAVGDDDRQVRQEAERPRRRAGSRRGRHGVALHERGQGDAGGADRDRQVAVVEVGPGRQQRRDGAEARAGEDGAAEDPQGGAVQAAGAGEGDLRDGEQAGEEQHHDAEDGPGRAGDPGQLQRALCGEEPGHEARRADHDGQVEAEGDHATADRQAQQGPDEDQDGTEVQRHREAAGALRRRVGAGEAVHGAAEDAGEQYEHDDAEVAPEAAGGAGEAGGAEAHGGGQAGAERHGEPADRGVDDHVRPLRGEPAGAQQRKGHGAAQRRVRPHRPHIDRHRQSPPPARTCWTFGRPSADLRDSRRMCELRDPQIPQSDLINR
ncbi:hypothetical protein OHA72_01950 [Dactylosporangium sp. NBC_01737]|nr:hypothetical protein OHA72_01950 [Dactylosporangium sp. NBC_01737]